MTIKARKNNLTPEERVRITCDLSNTALHIFLSSLEERYPNHTREDRIKFLKQLVKERERIRRDRTTD